jgi:predicted enzyme involved in methoxymalonyl-ACP biosynthesis
MKFFSKEEFNMRNVALALIFGASSMAFASEVVTETEEVKVETQAVEEVATDSEKEEKLTKDETETAEGEETATAPVATPEKG